MEIHDIVKKLIGPVTPVGKSEVDSERLNNLVVLCDLVEQLILDIEDIDYIHGHSHQASIKKICEYSKEFLNNIKE
jgi:hypothetical protein